MNLPKSKLFSAIAITLVSAQAFATNVSSEPMIFDMVQDVDARNKNAKIIEKQLLKVGVSPALVAQSMAIYNAPLLMQNGDSENAEVTCKDYSMGNFHDQSTCADYPIDLSDTTADIVFFYHPNWSEKQKSLGQAYKAAKTEIAKANEIFGKNTPVKLRLVGFEQPTFAGYRDFEIAYFGQEKYDNLVALGYDEFPNSVDMNTINSATVYNADGSPRYGLDFLLTAANSFVSRVYSGKVDSSILPSDANKQYRYGADITIWARLPDLKNSPTESQFCGAAGNNSATVLLGSDTLNSNHCPLVITHEIGHIYKADHELAHKGTEISNGKEVLRTRATAAPCGNSHTIMYYASVSGLKQTFSSPDAIIDGEVCGDEKTMNNAKQISITAPFVANIANRMDVLGDVWFSSDSVVVSESADKLSFIVERNGDVTKSASVKVFIDDGYKYLDNDFIDVEFAIGESKKTVSLNVIDNNLTTENPNLIAELVTPLQLAISPVNDKLTITVTNDDVPVVIPPVTPEKPDTPKSSGGGSMGFVSLLLLAITRRLRN